MINTPLMPTFNRVLAFDRDLSRVVAGLNGKRFFTPSIDVVERTDAYLISAELPGVDPSAVEISFEGNTLTLRGAKQRWLQPQKAATSHQPSAYRHGLLTQLRGRPLANTSNPARWNDGVRSLTLSSGMLLYR